MLYKVILLFCLSTIVSMPSLSYASEDKWVSIKSNLVNMRSGPNMDYPILWIYCLRHLPLKLLTTFDNWSKVVDVENTEGWINNRLLSNKRYIIILNNNTKLYKNIAKSYRGIVHKNAVLEYISVNNEWCKVKYKSAVLFINKHDVWGC